MQRAASWTEMRHRQLVSVIAAAHSRIRPRNIRMSFDISNPNATISLHQGGEEESSPSNIIAPATDMVDVPLYPMHIHHRCIQNHGLQRKNTFYGHAVQYYMDLIFPYLSGVAVWHYERVCRACAASDFRQLYEFGSTRVGDS
mmetsp:Transcript_18796/g.27883  ORF Transcript_18796/g.27883 Transcript_18796/m.27883 type:complete len:143 (+) Transcript_18796:144-572(+)